MDAVELRQVVGNLGERFVATELEELMRVGDISTEGRITIDCTEARALAPPPESLLCLTTTSAQLLWNLLPRMRKMWANVRSMR